MKVLYIVIFISHIFCSSFLQLNANFKVSQSQFILLRRVRIDEQIIFADKRLEDCIREKIRQPMGVILRSDVKGVTELDLSNKGIESLNGIEFFTGLKTLLLSNNQINNISSLENVLLRGLDEFTIDGNNNLTIADLQKLDIWMQSGQRNMAQAENLNQLGYRSIPVVRGDLIFTNDVYGMSVKDGCVVSVMVMDSGKVLWEAEDEGIKLVHDVRILKISDVGNRLVLIGRNGVFDIPIENNLQ
ncbi:MAG: hypothetical protein P9M06_07030 [Candidatus Saelkia tenebricola]|nr:hypothetical protein [Candidatus Saelkia tenebricola]